MDITLPRLNEIFSTAFGQPIALSNNSSKENMELWDSINHLNLIVELEAELNVSFTPSEIEKINSVDALIQILKNK